jgi:hypothetical protein
MPVEAGIPVNVFIIVYYITEKAAEYQQGNERLTGMRLMPPQRRQFIG